MKRKVEPVNETPAWCIRVERMAFCNKSLIRVYSWWSKGDPLRVRYEITGNKLNIGSLWTKDWTVEQCWERAVAAMRRERPRAKIHHLLDAAGGDLKEMDFTQLVRDAEIRQSR